MKISEEFSIDDLVDDPSLDRGKDATRITVEVRPYDICIAGNITSHAEESGEMPEHTTWVIGDDLDLLREGTPARDWAYRWQTIAEKYAKEGRWC